MNRGVRRQSIYASDADRHRFTELLSRLDERYGVEINAFAFMGNHYHLLVRSRRGELSRALHYLDGTYAQKFNRHNGFDGPLFRGRFKSRLVEEGDYLRNVLAYIHQNPVAAGLVDRPEDYKWSSYRTFLKETTNTSSWLATTALHLCGIHSQTQLILATHEKSPVPPLHDTPGQVFYGSERFVSRHLELLEKHTGDIAAPHDKIERPTFDEILTAVCAVFGVSDEEVLTPTRGRQNDARTAAIGLSQEVGGLSLTDCADRFSLASDRAAGSRSTAFRRLLPERDFAQKEARIRRILIGESELLTADKRRRSK